VSRKAASPAATLGRNALCFQLITRSYAGCLEVTLQRSPGFPPVVAGKRRPSSTVFGVHSAPRKEESRLVRYASCDRSGEISPAASRTELLDLQPSPLLDSGMAIRCPLARSRLPQIRFLCIGSHACSTRPADPSSPKLLRSSSCIRLHQIVKETCTPKLSNMLGTRGKGRYRLPFQTQDPAGRRLIADGKWHGQWGPLLLECTV
jgi:hypothetical protein